MKAIVFDNELKLDNNYPKPIPQEEFEKVLDEQEEAKGGC